MATQVSVKVTAHKNKTDNTEYFEAQLTVVGAQMKATKLTRADGTTQFPNKAAAQAVVRKMAEKFAWEVVEAEEPVKKAAKRTPKKAEKAEAQPATWVEGSAN